MLWAGDCLYGRIIHWVVLKYCLDYLVAYTQGKMVKEIRTSCAWDCLGNCTCTWCVPYSLSCPWLHAIMVVAYANATLFLNQWFCTWISSFQNVTLRALLITAPLFFIYLWAVILLQSFLFQSMKAWRPFSIHRLVLMWASWDAVNGLLVRTCSSIVIVLGSAFFSNAFWI